MSDLSSLGDVTGHEPYRSYEEKPSRHGGRPGCTVADCLVVAGVLLVIVGACLAGRVAGAGAGCGVDSFESWPPESEFTREWAPYTGTVNLGPWGPQPWAEGASPHDRPDRDDWTLGLP